MMPVSVAAMPKLRPMSLKSAMGINSVVLKINAPIAKATMLNQGFCEAFIVVVLMGIAAIMRKRPYFFKPPHRFRVCPSSRPDLQ